MHGAALRDPISIHHKEPSTMKPFSNALWALAAVALISGCASSVPLEDKPPVESRTGTSVGPGGAGAGAGGAGQSQVTSVDLSKGAGADSREGRTVYFDYDSYVVKDQYRSIVDTNAKALAADRKKRMTLEGHTDERGGREYNLALGHKRAESVKKMLGILGVQEAQMETISFGKEKPRNPGTDEAAYAENRRSDLVYQGE